MRNQIGSSYGCHRSLRGPRSLGKTHLVRWQGGHVTVRGVLHVHSAPPALGPHIEWAVGGVLGVPVTLPWVDQPASPGMLRTELAWQGPPAAGGAITSALATWNLLRFEVTEEASPGCDSVRYSYTPSLGLFSATTTASGDLMFPEPGCGPCWRWPRRAARPRPVVSGWRPTTGTTSATCAKRTGRGTRRSAGHWRRSCACSSATPGTTSSSRSATPRPVPPSAGSTPPADRAAGRECPDCR